MIKYFRHRKYAADVMSSDRQPQTRALLLVLLFICTLLLNVSCKKYLEKKQDAKLVVPSNLNELQALLDNSSVMNDRSPSWDEASADDYYLRQPTYDALSTKGQGAYKWENIEYSFGAGNDWSFLYDIVNASNVVLDNIIKIPRNSSNNKDWDNIKGSALVFRANTFLKAAWLFANAYDENSATQDYGIVLRLSSDLTLPSVRANVKETYNQVINDLKESITLLPDFPVHPFRPSKGAVYGLLARAYLSMGKYDIALKYSDSCLQINHELQDYNDISNSTAPPFSAFNKEVIFHTAITTFTFFNVTATRARIDSNLYNVYSIDDLRKQLFFRLRESPSHYSFKGSYYGSTFLFTGLATDEVLLMRAECYARLGFVTEALSDLNDLLITRWITGTFNPVTASDAQEALGKILLERRKELVMRGLRWMDIKRLNKEGANIILQRNIVGEAFTLSPNDNRFALPLPSDVIELTGIPQNPK